MGELTLKTGNTMKNKKQKVQPRSRPRCLNKTFLNNTMFCVCLMSLNNNIDMK